MKYLLVLMLLIGVNAYCFEVPEGYQKITEECYLQIDPYGSEVKNYGRLHFRGAKYGTQEGILEVITVVSVIEGVMGCTPNYYAVDVTIGHLYSWEEVIPLIRTALYRLTIEQSPGPKTGKKLGTE